MLTPSLCVCPLISLTFFDFCGLRGILQLEIRWLGNRSEPPWFGLGPHVLASNSLFSPVYASLMLTALSKSGCGMNGFELRS